MFVRQLCCQSKFQTMNHKILIVFTFILFQSTILFAQTSKETISQKADVLLTDAYNKGIFSGAVVISKNGKKIYTKEMGFADGKAKRAADKNTLFNIGSLNKKFTQEIISQLVVENKLSYTDKLSKYLDLFPVEIGNTITIQQLINMKAGLGDFLQNPHYFEEMRFKNFSLSDLIELIKNEPLLFEPGTSIKYSNSGYVVLGAVIEKITGKSYEENLHDRIVSPLELNNIYYTKAEITSQTNRAFGINIEASGNKKNTDEVANSTPAGGIYTNIEDLLKFVEVKLMPQKPLGDRQGVPLFAGGSPNWSSAISYNYENGFAIVVMANLGDDIAVKIAKRLNSILNDEPYPPLEIAAKLPLAQIINELGYEYIKANAEKLATQQRLPYDDHFLNDAAIQFLDNNKPDIAINLFKVNIELFPKSVFTYDILAQTYLKTGDKINALKYFKTVLEFDPNNQAVKKIVSDLDSKN